MEKLNIVKIVPNVGIAENPLGSQALQVKSCAGKCRTALQELLGAPRHRGAEQGEHPEVSDGMEPQNGLGRNFIFTSEPE